MVPVTQVTWSRRSLSYLMEPLPFTHRDFILKLLPTGTLSRRAQPFPYLGSTCQPAVCSELWPWYTPAKLGHHWGSWGQRHWCEGTEVSCDRKLVADTGSIHKTTTAANYACFCIYRHYYNSCIVEELCFTDVSWGVSWACYIFQLNG